MNRIHAPRNRLPFLRHLGRAPARRLRDDERGALPVFEAIVAGMLVLTAILFLTAVGRPSPAAGESGIDLGQNAADTLAILRDRDDTQHATDPDLYPHRLAEIVERAMVGDTTDAKTFLDSIVPTGTRYLLRLDNGVEPLVLLPTGSGPSLTPRAAQAAAVLVTPDWNANGKPSDNPGLQTIRPGQVIPAGHAASQDYSQPEFLVGPHGSTLMPDGTAWRLHWDAQSGGVPPDAPYGVWRWCDQADCVGGSGVLSAFKVVHPSGAESDYPVYGVQLVVWLAA